MKQTINFSQFVDGFETRKDNFTYNGLKALYDYFEDLEDGLGEEIEFDPIAICCEWTQYEDLKEIKGNYWDLNGNKDYTIDDLRDWTQVIEFEGGIIILDF